MRLTAFVLLAASFAFAQNARVEGRIVTTAGTPVAGATAELNQNQPAALVTIGRPKSYAGTTRADGTFTIDNVPPGEYIYWASMEGFVVVGNPPPLTLVAGQRFEGLEIVLAPMGVVTGRVLDDNGEPLPKMHVAVWRSAYQRGRRGLSGPFAHANTDDRGVYRTSLPPGRYVFIAEDSQTRVAISTGKLAVPENESAAYVPTLYPSVLTVDTATGVEVGSGANVQGIDIRLRKEPIYSIRGKALGPDGKAAANVTLGLHARERLSSNARILTTTGADGSFLFPRLMAGAYLISTMPAEGKIDLPPAEGRLNVVIVKTGIDDAVFQLMPRPEVTGTVWNEEGAPLKGDPLPMLMLDDVDDLPVVGGGKLEKDGSFTAQGIAPTKYRVGFLNPLPGHYLKSVRFSGRDITGQLLDLTSGVGGRLEIVVSSKAAVATGVVRDSRGETASGVWVTLWGRDEIVRTAQSDQYGSYRFGELAPGEYRVAAWENVESGLIQNAAFRAAFAADTERIELKEGQQKGAELKLIPRARSDREAARVP